MTVVTPRVEQRVLRQYNGGMNHNKPFKRRSLRNPIHDYQGHHNYLVTLCTKNRARLFGRIEGGRVLLSPAGRIVNDCWMEIPNHFSVASLDAFIVMPDHLHGIIAINPGPEYRTLGKCDRMQVLPGSL